MGRLPKGEQSIVVTAPPEQVYAVVSDVTRTGEWSPECVACEWTGEMTFRGTNRRGTREWVMDAVVDEAVPPERFEFHTEREGAPRTRWGWRLEATVDGGTRVTQFWERLAPFTLMQRLVERFVLGGREAHNAENLAASLERVKILVEQPGDARQA